MRLYGEGRARLVKGFECGLVIAGIADYQPDDRIECFVEEVVAVK